MMIDQDTKGNPESLIINTSFNSDSDWDEK